jgi:hypothetical protein
VAICQTAGDAFFIGEMETFGESRYLDFAPAIKRDDLVQSDSVMLRTYVASGVWDWL